MYTSVSQLNHSLSEYSSIPYGIEMSREITRLMKMFYEVELAYVEDRFEDGVAAAQRLLSKWPDFAGAHLVGAQCLLGLGRYRDALDLLLVHGKSAAPEWHKIPYVASLAYDALGDHLSELRQLADALEIHSNHPDSIWSVALTYYQNLDMPDLAEYWFHRYLDVVKRNRTEHMHVKRCASAWLHIAQIAFSMFRDEEALRSCQHSLELMPFQESLLLLEQIRDRLSR
jgi:tetratricopeptide (TPR) repeat protein